MFDMALLIAIILLIAYGFFIFHLFNAIKKLDKKLMYLENKMIDIALHQAYISHSQQPAQIVHVKRGRRRKEKTSLKGEVKSSEN